MKITYDPETDTLTIRLKDVHISESDELQDGIIADLDHSGDIIGLEILDASKRVTEPQNIIFESTGHPMVTTTPNFDGQEFHKALVHAYRRAKEECGYNATYFLSMLTKYGGLLAAQRLLASDDIQYGFTELWKRNRLDLTVEAHVLKPEFKQLFTEKERQRARERLEAHGYQV